MQPEIETLKVSMPLGDWQKLFSLSRQLRVLPTECISLLIRQAAIGTHWHNLNGLQNQSEGGAQR